jgi:hypothetical protein
MSGIFNQFTQICDLNYALFVPCDPYMKRFDTTKRSLLQWGNNIRSGYVDLAALVKWLVLKSDLTKNKCCTEIHVG